MASSKATSIQQPSGTQFAHHLKDAKEEYRDIYVKKKTTTLT